MSRRALIDDIASAIATMEGYWVAGSLPKKYNNPGDLRGAPWLQNPVMDRGYVKFASPEDGISGLYHQIALNVARGMTLRQLIAVWAPPADHNDTTAYQQAVAAMTGLPLDMPLKNLLELTLMSKAGGGKVTQ